MFSYQEFLFHYYCQKQSISDHNYPKLVQISLLSNYKMNWANVYDKLSFDLAGRHFYGRQVVQGIALGLAVTAIYGLKRYFAGGWCNVTRDLTGRNVVITGGNGGIGK